MRLNLSYLRQTFHIGDHCGGEEMPRSGTRSKKSRGKARKAATPRDPTPPGPANAFAALAAPDEEEPSDGEEEEPEQGQEE